MAISKNIDSKPGLGSSQNVPACARCSGLLIKEELFDPFDDTGLMHQWAWRCAQCGNIVDSLILKHRACANLSTPNTASCRRWTAVQAITRNPIN
ncbi:MAG: hypothetical protein OXF39_10050 [Nitrospira sp.]|nr:hypothetical protein [Nitrospira sp.]